MHETPPTMGFDPHDPTLFVEPPRWPKVVGTLSIVFGAIAVFCGGIGTVMAPLAPAMNRTKFEGAPTPYNMLFSPLDWAIMCLALLVNVGLIIAGVLCVRRRPVARPAHLVYAIASLVSLGLSAWMQTGKQQDLERWIREFPDTQYAQEYNQVAQMMGPIILIFIVVMVLISLSWPTFCLIWFGLIKTKHHQMTGAPVPEGAGAMV